MTQLRFSSTGNLEITPSKNSSECDFDFLLGKWKIHNRKLKTRLNSCSEWLEFEATHDCQRILNGFGNMEQFTTEFNGIPFYAMGLRLFNPRNKLWSIYWADSNVVVLDVPQVGSFEDNIGTFYARDVFEEKPIMVMFNWDKTNPEVPVWSQAFSVDEGDAWEWNWYMTFYQQK